MAGGEAPAGGRQLSQAARSHITLAAALAWAATLGFIPSRPATGAAAAERREEEILGLEG